MDLRQFGLIRQPFRSHPDPSVYCPTATHERAESLLARSFHGTGGVALLSGPAGIGKTLLTLRFLGEVPETAFRIVLQAAPRMSATEFFQAILFDLGLPYQGLSEHELRLAVNEQLCKALARSQQGILVIDEAQHLLPGVLEEVRLLMNWEAPQAPGLYALLIAQPSFDYLLKHDVTRALQQRVVASAVLEPLSQDDLIRLLRHQLRECGGRPEWLITDEAQALLAESSEGLPRLLNRAAYLAFQIAEAAGVKEVDAEVVLEALDQLHGFQRNESSKSDAVAILPMKPVVKTASESRHDGEDATITSPKSEPQSKRSKRKSA